MNEMTVDHKEIEELTPEQLGGEIRLLTSQARRMALSYAIQIGYRLKVAHEKVGPHGWAEWLKAETEFSAAAASRFEKLYEGYGEAQGSLFGVGNNFPTLEKISVSNALRLLAVPEEEREQVARELDAEHLSARELEKALAERDEARKQLQDTSARLEDTQKALAHSSENESELLRKLSEAKKDVLAADEMAEKNERELKARIQELENRPVEVAVERDEEAVRKAAEEAKKAAEAAAQAELDRLRAKLQKAQADQRKAEEEKRRAIRESPLQAEEAKAEAEKARAEADELRKKLRAAESGAGEVAMLARQAQVNFEAAMEKISAMQGTHPDVAGRMLTGMERIAENLTARIREAKSR